VAWETNGPATPERSAMNFRLVWMGPDDDPQGASAALKGAVRHSSRVHPPYAKRRGEMVRQETTQSGRLKSRTLANFQARIVRDLVLDDGERERHEFAVEAVLGETRRVFSVSAAEFSRMGWVLNKLGPQAIIYPGQHQHARAAIQWLSGKIPQGRVFSHLGWRKCGAQWLYLHAGGALGSDGAVSSMRVQLPVALNAYRIIPAQNSRDRALAIQDSLRFLSVAPDRISFPLLAGVYCAALGRRGFSLFLAGRSGVFKTTLAALCQQHFGSTMDATRVPASFASTANSLESLAFHAKDALLVTDDFAPSGTQGDHELHVVAERLFRAAGNQQGRSRMSNAGPSAPRPPRALVLGTGEEVPQGQSIRARLLIVEVSPGDVDRAMLDECQKAAQQGRFAASMGSFLVWIAGRYDELQQRLEVRVQEIRGQGRGRAVHARLPASIAELQAGFEIFLEFAHEVAAIGKVELEDLAQRTVRALDELTGRQAKYHHTSDPASRFLNLLQAGLSHGRAYVSDRGGKVPPDPMAWGWHRKSPGRAWVPHGVKIGWLAGTNLYLDPSSSYRVAQELAGSERLPVSEQTLRHRLRERGLLASVDAGRQMLLVRRTFEGRPRQVLHLRAADLVSPGLIPRTTE